MSSQDHHLWQGNYLHSNKGKKYFNTDRHAGLFFTKFLPTHIPIHIKKNKNYIMHALIGSQLCLHRSGKHYICSIFYERDIKRLSCLHSLMQTLEGFGENSKSLCVNHRHSHNFFSSPKLPLKFASGYVNTGRILHFLNIQ